MSAQFRAPDPVRAHMNGAWLKSPVPAAPRASARPRAAHANHRRALAVAAITLLAPAVGAASLLGLGTVGDGVSQSLGSLQGAVGLTGSADAGRLGGEAKEKRFDQREDFAADTSRAAARAPARRPLKPLAPKKPAPGPIVVPVGDDPPAPSDSGISASPGGSSDDDTSGPGNGSGGPGNGSGGSGY